MKRERGERGSFDGRDDARYNSKRIDEARARCNSESYI